MIPSEDNALPFKRGSVGIATSGFDTGGSQFFICHSRQPHLDGNYTLFANVIDGIEVIDLITQGDYIETIQLDKH
jgi:peptidyl-prolyl cis-trans isomerase B (cyclophilin B)